ncbi:unnamed protein product [Ilex paraguariensis]|uniref:Isopenicillin N synthase-like Fe(2+) 2OG dioxygenase domain-containing protein n=1 Tax=Ilex paraguariensis TaxID=185542 RepID=A0ABC8SEA0_9AQUA
MNLFYIDGLTTYAIELLGGQVGSNTYGGSHLANKWNQKHVGLFQAFIVNLGDMLERWSNSMFRSTLHRVLGNGQERYSIAFFVEPNHDCLVECLPTCQSPENPPNGSSRLSPIVIDEYSNCARVLEARPIALGPWDGP